MGTGTVKAAPKRQERQITLRLPPTLYESVKQVARQRRTSINRLAQEGLEQMTRREMAAQMCAAYEELGEEAESNVETLLPAQREVVLRGPE